MPLQKPLRGLSSFLGQYRLGQLDAEWDPGLKAGFPVERFLAPTTTVLTSSTIFNAGVNQTILVPSNEIWLLYSVSIWSYVVVAAGDTIDGAAWIQRQSGAYEIAVPVNPGDASGPGKYWYKGNQFGRPIHLYPGEGLTMELTEKATADGYLVGLSACVAKIGV